MKYSLYLLLLLFLPHQNYGASLQTNGRYLMNSSGDTIILRGVNYPLIDDGSISLANPAQYQAKIDQFVMTGANCIRLPWYTSGTHWRDLPGSGGTAGTVQGYLTNGHLSNIIAYCHAKGLIPILEIHDGTCSNNWTYFNSTISNWWKSTAVQNLITAHKDYLIINIANEFGYVQWSGAAASARSTFTSNYNALISSLRGLGVTVPIMIDAPDCGQSSSDLMLMSNSLYTNDPLHNIIFSAHAYWSGYASTQTQVQAKLNQAVDSNRCFVLGEIAISQDNTSCGQISLATLYPIILQEACPRKIGWLAWTYDQDCHAARELTTNGQFANLTSYGNDIVYNANYGLLSTTGCGSTPRGNTFANPILATLPYTKVLNTQAGTGFTSMYQGANPQTSPDIFIKVLTGPCCDSLKISTCGSSINTVVHLLNASGTQLFFNDDNGPYCLGTAASLKSNVNPNTTYYIVLEGNGSSSGAMNLTIEEINTFPIVTASPASGCTGATVPLTASPSGGVFSVANPYTGPSTTYTYSYTNVDGCTKVSNAASITIAPCFTTLNLNLFLQGYMNGVSQMQAVKMNQGVGNSSTVCDDIQVTLRNTSPPYAIAAGPLTVSLSTLGMATAIFPLLIGNYYIDVQHRHSIEVWSKNAVPISANCSYDFTTGVDKAYGNNLAYISAGVYGLFTGDMNQDGYVDGFDYPLFDMDAQQNVSGVYVETDLNGDGYVDGFDYPVFDTNSQMNISAIHP